MNVAMLAGRVTGVVEKLGEARPAGRHNAMTAQQIVRLHRAIRREGQWNFDLKRDAETLARRLEAQR